jgi:hypothetical protein
VGLWCERPGARTQAMGSQRESETVGCPHLKTTAARESPSSALPPVHLSD